MIRDIFISRKDGIPIFYRNFGDCHSVSDNIDLISGFLSALQMFSREITDEDIKFIKLEEKIIVMEEYRNHLFVIIAEKDDELDILKTKAKRIAELFFAKYGELIDNFSGDRTVFSGFGDYLIELNITRKNCGGLPECAGCPNASKNLEIEKLLQELGKKKKGLLARIRGLFGGGNKSARSQKESNWAANLTK